jgi:colanic acid/amylovoran biosynthesis glycosyltransferase
LSTLLLFTASYPFDFASEQTFLDREVYHLAKYFNRLIIIPKIAKGNKLAVPTSVEVETGFANYFSKHAKDIRIFLHAITSKHFYRELRSHFSLLIQPVKFARLVLFAGRAELTRKWLMSWLESHHEDVNQIVFYSFWFDDITMGLGLIKQKYSQIKLVTRAHGYDIYEEQYFPYYWPLRREILTKLDKVFPASKDGKEYFRSHYPEFKDLFETAHLGTEDPGFISKASADNVLRIVSCAHIFPLKRIDLLCKGVALAAQMRPEQSFEWHHFGDGKARKTLQKMIARSFPSNAKGFLPGYVPNQDIMRHYRDDPVDVFVNLSTTEGGAPVAIQEAISCGIPVIATNVGGNPEIVSERNGILLDPNLTPEDVSRALLKISDDPQLTQKMRQESRRIWEESYNAEVNFRDFAEKLAAIRQG